MAINKTDSLVQTTVSVTSGTFSLNGTNGLVLSSGTGRDDTEVTMVGTVADINAALDGLRYMPDANFTGTADMTVTTNNLASPLLGGPKPIPTPSPSTSPSPRNTRDSSPPITTAPTYPGRASNASIPRSTLTRQTQGGNESHPLRGSQHQLVCLLAGQNPGHHHRRPTRSMSPGTTASDSGSTTLMSTAGLINRAPLTR